MPRRAPALAVLVVLATACVSEAQKEFADCGSTALMPLKLELDPDPAEVFAHAMSHNSCCTRWCSSQRRRTRVHSEHSCSKTSEGAEGVSEGVSPR